MRPVRNIALMVYATACALLVGTILLTNWPTYSYQVRGGFIPLYYYALPGILVIPIMFAHPDAPLCLLRSPIFWWFTVYVLLGLLWQVGAQDFSEETSSAFRLRLLVFLVFVTTATILSESNRLPVAVLIAVCVLLAGAFNWFDSLRPFRFVPQGIEGATEGRGAGLFMNPNTAGSFVVMGTIAALPFVPMRFRALALTAAVMCLAPTFSRGAFVLVAVAAVSAILLGLVRRMQIILVLVAVPLLIIVVNFGYDYLMTHSEDRNMRSVVERLVVLTDSGVEDDSVDTRADAATRAWALFKQNPLYGAGLGATTSLSFVTGPHNMYVTLMGDQGVFGLGLYLSLLLLLTQTGWRLMRSAPTPRGADIGRATIMLALCLAVNGFFSHNVLDEPQSMFLLAFLVAAGLQAQRATGAPAASSPAARLSVRRPPRLIRW